MFMVNVGKYIPLPYTMDPMGSICLLLINHHLLLPPLATFASQTDLNKRLFEACFVGAGNMGLSVGLKLATGHRDVHQSDFD